MPIILSDGTESNVRYLLNHNFRHVCGLRCSSFHIITNTIIICEQDGMNN